MIYIHVYIRSQLPIAGRMEETRSTGRPYIKRKIRRGRLVYSFVHVFSKVNPKTITDQTAVQQ